MVTTFYRWSFFAGVLAIPLAFAYNAQLFRLLNCSKGGHWLDWVFLTLTSLADGLWVVMIVTLVQSIRPRNFNVFMVALVIGNIFLQSAKYFIDADRPVLVFGADQVCVLGQTLSARSFPSGHSFSALLLFLFLRPKKSLLAAVVLLTIAIAAAISRAYVGAHFPRDIIAGGFMAVLAYVAAEGIAPKLTGWKIPQFVREISLTVVGLGAALIYIFVYKEKTRQLEFILTPLAYAVAVWWIVFFSYRIYRQIRPQSL